MSAGRFEIRIYEADSGDNHYIRQQPETATLEVGGNANTVPEGDATSTFWVKESKGPREFGLGPRRLRLQWLPGQQPAGYKEEETFTIVIYKQSVYNSALIRNQGTYNGGACKVVGKIPESMYPVS